MNLHENWKADRGQRYIDVSQILSVGITSTRSVVGLRVNKKKKSYRLNYNYKLLSVVDWKIEYKIELWNLFNSKI